MLNAITEQITLAIVSEKCYRFENVIYQISGGKQTINKFLTHCDSDTCAPLSAPPIFIRMPVRTEYGSRPDLNWKSNAYMGLGIKSAQLLLAFPLWGCLKLAKENLFPTKEESLDLVGVGELSCTSSSLWFFCLGHVSNFFTFPHDKKRK